MPLYLIERQLAEALDVTASGVDRIREVLDANRIAGVEWLFSFLSADKKKTFCLYEAPSADAIRKAARLARLAADMIIEVDQLAPENYGFPTAFGTVSKVGPFVPGR